MKVKVPKVYAGPPWLLGGFFAVCCFGLSVTLVTNERYFWAVVFAGFGLWLSYLSSVAITTPWVEEEEEEEEEEKAQPREGEESEPEPPSAEERAIRNIMDRPH